MISNIKEYKAPTGVIYTCNHNGKPVEFLSVQDYGKAANIKADFLGFTDEIKGVDNGTPLLPLTEKWVMTLSSQHGCNSNCVFCDVPMVGRGINITYGGLWEQIDHMIMREPEIGMCKRLNIHYARMGEPTWNFNIIRHALDMKNDLYMEWKFKVIHPVVSTMLPSKNKRLREFIDKWVILKNEDYNGDAGLQFSINSTSDEERDYMFSGNSLDLDSISTIGEALPMPVGRKYTLNFVVCDDYTIDAKKLRELFSPDKFICKLTPLHMNISCQENGIETIDGYTKYHSYREKEQALIAEGFDVIVFVPSLDEDEGMITCGNAVLSGRQPKLRGEQ